MATPSVTAGICSTAPFPLLSNPAHAQGSFCTTPGPFIPPCMPLLVTLGLGDFTGACNSNEEFVLAGLLSRSKLSPLTLCPTGLNPAPPAALDEAVLWREGLRAGGPRICTIFSGSPRNEGEGGSCFGFEEVMKDLRSYLLRI